MKRLYFSPESFPSQLDTCKLKKIGIIIKMITDLFSDFILRWLDSNQLTGEIPSSFGNLVNLTQL
jgi:hypothetical protein